jgi:hypothetical protein
MLKSLMIEAAFVVHGPPIIRQPARKGERFRESEASSAACSSLLRHCCAAKARNVVPTSSDG